MKLTPKQREQVRIKYQGRCSYCGNQLTDKWHADHMKPVNREGHWKGRSYVQTGVLRKPEHDQLDNMTPACIPCNVDKSDSSLEAWRKRLERSTEILRTNYSTYRHALRFKLINEAPAKVTFFFEQPQRRRITT